ncbi:MAG: hypothetical protein ACR2MA_01275 [Egibacteraceae bacterium]
MKDPDGAATAGLVAEWRRAEERLYPVAMIDTERYAQFVSVVRATADRLSSCETMQELAETYSGAHEVVTRAVGDVGSSTEEFGDVSLVAGAAFHLRYRELLVEQHRRDVAARIEAGRERGDRWVVLHESGREQDPLAQPYERVEMCFADGRGLRASVDVDPDTYRPVYRLDELRFDLGTSALHEAAAATQAGRSFSQREPWERATTELRDRAAAEVDADAGAVP